MGKNSVDQPITLMDRSYLQNHLCPDVVMAPPRGLSMPRALKVKKRKNKPKIFWSRNRRSMHGFEPYFACLKLHTFSMVPAHFQAPQASKTTSTLQFVFCMLFSLCTLLRKHDPSNSEERLVAHSWTNRSPTGQMYVLSLELALQTMSLDSHCRAYG